MSISAKAGEYFPDSNPIIEKNFFRNLKVYFLK